MGGYKRLLKHVADLEWRLSNCCDEMSHTAEYGSKLVDRILHLECGEHEWLFTGMYCTMFVNETRYQFKCAKCGKTVSLGEDGLVGTMRPQLELLGHLKPIEEEASNG